VPIKNVSFSFDGRLLASKAADGVRLWRCDTWEMVSALSEPQKVNYLFSGLAFHPAEPVLATLDDDNRAIRIWDLDFDEILGGVSSSKTTLPKPSRYANAKVVLIGDTGVGKSGLAYVLTGQPWEKTESTHGRRVWLMDAREAEVKAGLAETRETLLWDLAGQPDYRLIHQLHLTEVAVALVVFDSRSQTDPFAGVRHWDRALRQARRVQGDAAPQCKKFLVAARADVGRVGVSRERIESLKLSLDFDEYFETSAKEGWGVEELARAIREAVDWGSLPTVSSTALFQSIKSFLVSEKETGRLLSTADDLYRAFLRSSEAPPEDEHLRAQFDTCVGRVESRGLIQRLSFGDLVLLQPELQDVYASAMANAAKDEPDGLGCIREEDARAGEFRIPEGERIANREQEKLLLISTVEELLRHEIALREHGDDGQYLVFPSQLTRENPDLPDPEGKSVVFNFEGPVLNVYATLAVRLSHSGLFRKKEMWKNAATYAALVGGTCGMFLREVEEGRGELTLFFDAAAGEETRFQFEEFVHTHLRRRALPETVQRRRVFVCPDCATPVADLQAKRRRERGHDWIACNVCETRISILDREERLPARSSRVPDMERAADLQRERETAASILQGKIATNDFDVFLCYNHTDRSEVLKVGEQLKERGLLPWLDVWELQPGIPWQPELEKQIGQIKSAAVFVRGEGIGPWQQQEVNALLREFVRRRCPVIPVILPGGRYKPALPIFLKGMTWVDFRSELLDPLDSLLDPLDKLIWGITGERASARQF
jgi:small GTP-binding protein